MVIDICKLPYKHLQAVRNVDNKALTAAGEFRTRMHYICKQFQLRFTTCPGVDAERTERYAQIHFQTEMI